MNKIIDITIKYIKNELKNVEAGHNWWHVKRVFDLATFIAQKEGGNLLVIQLASLLHDIADYKFYNGNEEIGKKKIKSFLSLNQVDNNTIKHIEKIIENISYKGGNFQENFDSLEFRIVQDADRLDAMGAIGIARAFHYGGYKNNEIYNPDIEIKLNLSPIEYLNAKSTTINHFFEKLLLLKELLNTKTAQKLAEKKHKFMLSFLEEFFDEWDILENDI
jgi:uncharacterized protein